MVDKLDIILQNNDVIFDLIKIDLEGFEYNALIGMEKLLKNQKPDILIEILDKNNELDKIKTLLTSFDLLFTIKKIDKYDNYLIIFN